MAPPPAMTPRMSLRLVTFIDVSPVLARSEVSDIAGSLGLFSSTELRNRILEARCRAHAIFGVLLFQLSFSAHNVSTARNDLHSSLMPLCVMPHAESSASLHHFNYD